MKRTATLLAASALAMPTRLETKDADPGNEQKGNAPDTVEIKKAIDGFMTTFEEFKSKVTSELEETKKRGSADVVTVDQVKKLNDALDEQKKLVDELRLDAKRPQITGHDGEKRAMTADEQKHRDAFLSFMRKGSEEGLADLQTKALSAGVNPDGGYVVPFELDRTIDRVLSEVSPIRAISSVMQISTGSLKKPVNMGGAGSGWVGEKESRPQTATPTLNMLEFPVMELYANPAATQTLLDDAYINIEQWLADEVQITFAEQEGAAFVNGNGVNKPHGFLAYDTVANANYAWGKLGFTVSGGASDFAATDPEDVFIDLIHSLKAGYRTGARFVMNSATQAKVRKFKDGNDNFIWQPGLQAGQPDRLLGYPITEAEDMPDVGAGEFPIAFGNFNRGYQIVDRIGTRVLRDPYTAKPFVLFYTTKRVGGGVKNFEAIKLLKISS
jgi:HK97 family phage major capsid protein